ncbi:hypothetical protein V8E36_003497 [Tilletia maclaganii]
MQFQSFVTLALSVLSATSALASEHDAARSRRHHSAIEAAVRSMANEHAANFAKRGTVNAVTTTCRTLLLKDITDDLTNRQMGQIVTYTNNEVLGPKLAGMTMFDINQFNDGGKAKNFSSIVGRWRKDTAYWVTGHDPAQQDTTYNGSEGTSFWDDLADFFGFKRDVAAPREPITRRAGSDGTDTTWYFSPITNDEVDETGLAQAQVCLNVTQSTFTTLEKNNCNYATYDAHGTLNDGGEVMVSIQQAVTISTTASTERTTSAGTSLGASVSVGFEAGWDEGIVAKVNGQVTASAEARWDVSNTIGTETTSETAVTNTVQITFNQNSNQTCWVQLSSQTCNSKIRLVTPVVLTGLVHLQSSPICKYNKDADGNCKNDLFVDLEQALKGFQTDAVIVQYVDLSYSSTGTYKQQCLNGTGTDSPFAVTTTTADPAKTLTVYGHTETAFALTTTVAESTGTTSVMTNTVTPTSTKFLKSLEVATATVYPNTRTVTVNNAKYVTVTATRRPPLKTHIATTTVYKGVRTVTQTPTTTVIKRVSQTLRPTRCRRSMDDDAEDAEDVFVRSEPTAAPVVVRRADTTVTAGASGTVTYDATTTLSDATTTFTDLVKPTTVTAVGQTTTVTEAIAGTKTMPEVTVTDAINTQFKFVTATLTSTKVISKFVRTETVRRPARTTTIGATVTRAASTRTVKATGTVTVKKTRTVTVTPPCTRRN